MTEFRQWYDEPIEPPSIDWDAFEDYCYEQYLEEKIEREYE